MHQTCWTLQQSSSNTDIYAAFPQISLLTGFTITEHWNANHELDHRETSGGRLLMSIQGLSEHPAGSAGHCARVYRDRSPWATRPLVAASANRPGVSHCLKPLRLGPRLYAAWLFCAPYRQDCLNLTSQLVCFHFKTFVLKWKSIKLLYLSPAQKTKSNRGMCTCLVQQATSHHSRDLFISLSARTWLINSIPGPVFS